MAFEEILDWVILSDIHSGCQLSLCPPTGAKMDEGGSYMPSIIQRKIWGYWKEFWDWVPVATKHRKFGVIFNGDAIDGVHHGSTYQISHNLADQANIAYEILAPIVESCEGRFYMIRGTEAHVGKSGVEEELLAKRLGAIPNEIGQSARFELWKKVGGNLVHVMHHIGTTASQAYEATAVHRELTESFIEAATTGEKPPQIVIRSHRHRYIQTTIPTVYGRAEAAVTPGWQAKTPFCYKIAGARLSQPQFGGLLVRQGDEEIFVKPWVKKLKRSRAE